MKRYAILALILIISISLIGISIVGAQDSDPTTIAESKHDLSAPAAEGGSGPGPIQSKFVTEICVFCHTPHRANSDAPLWNRSVNVNVGQYTLYTSDVMQELQITAEDPADITKRVHTKTRICLSCHDGTIALGSLANASVGFSSQIYRTDADGTILATSDGRLLPAAAGFIGTDLSDDHPVAVQHIQGTNSGEDPELNNPLDTTKSAKVTLYKLDGTGNKVIKDINEGSYVECTSCHNAHDNQYGNFLIDSNEQSKICMTCHRKETGGVTGGIGSGELAHDNATTPYEHDPDNGNPIGTTVGTIKCMNCHYPHRSGATGNDYPFTAQTLGETYGRYLLSFREENTCFNNPNRWKNSGTISACHSSGETLFSKSSNHGNTINPGKHEATEHGKRGGLGFKKYGWLGNTYQNWHVQCNDCHNPHTAGSVNHTDPLIGIGTNEISTKSPLYGAGGVEFNYTGLNNWPATPLTEGYFEPFESLGVTRQSELPIGYYEYQICFKCHSSYAWGGYAVPTLESLGGAAMTDQAREFNPSNDSYHPVVSPTKTHEGGASLVNGWQSGDTMYCSDCHADDGGASKGPHGSDSEIGNPPYYGFIMIANYKDTYSTTNTDYQPTDNICFKCHSEFVYQSGLSSTTGTGFSGSGINLHTVHKDHADEGGSSFGYRCVNCHTRVPHGYKNRAMIVLQNDGAPYEAGGTGQGKITWISFPTSGSYLVGDANKDQSCHTVSGCH